LATLWDTVVGHTAAKLSLQRAVEQNRTNHAYIFTGPRAVGKFMVARAFAAALIANPPTFAISVLLGFDGGLGLLASLLSGPVGALLGR